MEKLLQSAADFDVVKGVVTQDRPSTTPSFSRAPANCEYAFTTAYAMMAASVTGANAFTAAKQLASALEVNSLIAGAEAVAPGYVNFSPNNDAYRTMMDEILSKDFAHSHDPPVQPPAAVYTRDHGSMSWALFVDTVGAATALYSLARSVSNRIDIPLVRLARSHRSNPAFAVRQAVRDAERFVRSARRCGVEPDAFNVGSIDHPADQSFRDSVIVADTIVHAEQQMTPSTTRALCRAMEDVCINQSTSNRGHREHQIEHTDAVLVAINEASARTVRYGLSRIGLSEKYCDDIECLPESLFGSSFPPPGA